MNYYESHIGDYAAATSHLSWDEDMAYTRLIRAYYHTEKPIPRDQVYRMARASTPAQRRAVDIVIGEFFCLREGGYHQKRCDEEIAHYKDKQKKAKASAKARWDRTPSHSDGNADASPDASPDALRTHCEGNALQTPDTRHQTPDKKKTRTADSAVAARDPDEALPSPTQAGLVCRAMRQAGITDGNPGHPDLLALLAAGATDAEFVGAAQAAAARGKGFAYAIGALKGQRTEAAKTAQGLHHGALPATAPGNRKAAQLATAGLLTGTGNRTQMQPEIIDATDQRFIAS